jgi:hypothetical protein
MLASTRLDSTIFPTFLCKMSEPASAPTSITEQPRSNVDSLASPCDYSSIASISDCQYTMYNEYTLSSNASPSLTSLSYKEILSLPDNQFSSCCNNRSRDEDDNNWSMGWDILGIDEAGQEPKPLHARELPVIQKEESIYYPSLSKSRWSDEDNGRLFLVRRRLLRKGQKMGSESVFERWLIAEENEVAQPKIIFRM